MNTPEPPFTLTESERTSGLWLRLEGYWKGRLERLRAQNDGDRSEAETAKLRGQIAELKASLSLGREPVIQNQTPPEA